MTSVIAACLLEVYGNSNKESIKTSFPRFLEIIKSLKNDKKRKILLKWL